MPTPPTINISFRLMDLCTCTDISKRFFERDLQCNEILLISIIITIIHNFIWKYACRLNSEVLLLFFTSSIIIYTFFYNYLQVLLPPVPKQILEVVDVESHQHSNAGSNLGPWFWHLTGLSWLILEKLYHCEHEIEYQHISFRCHAEHHSFCFAKRLFHV